MSDPPPRVPLALVWSTDPLPEALDREALLDGMRSALAQTERFDLLPDPLADGATMLIELSPAPYPPDAWRLQLSLRDATGTTLEHYSMAADVDLLPGVASDVALQFAEPARYTELRRARGDVGNLDHPSVRAFDPIDASTLALAAVLNDPPAGLRARAEQFLSIGERTGDANHFLHAADLHELDGDFAAARAALGRLEQRATPDAVQAATWRANGLAAHEHLGRELVAMLLWVGRALGGAARGGGFAAPLPPDDIIDAVSVALNTHDCDFVMQRVGTKVHPHDLFGRYLGAVCVTAVERGPEQRSEAEEDALFATPWMRTLAPSGGSPAMVTPFATVLEPAWSLVRWDLWQRLASTRVEDLDALVAAHPDFQEAQARRAVLTIARGVEAVVAVVDPALPRVTEPLLRATLLCARGAARTDAGQPGDGLVDLDAALALAPRSLMVLRCRALTLNALLRIDEALAMIERTAVINPAKPDTHGLRGGFLVTAKRHAEALPHLELALQHTPSDANVWGNHGISLRGLNRLDEAEKSLRRAITMAPGLVPARFHLGMLLADVGRPSEARAELGWIVANCPPGSSIARDAKARLDGLGAGSTALAPSKSLTSGLSPGLLLFGLMALLAVIRFACAAPHG